MKKFIITESEKERILNMHRTAIKRQYLKESDYVEPGTVITDPRSQEFVDGSLGNQTDIGFSVSPNSKQYYYKCVADFEFTPQQIVGYNKPGAIYDANYNLKTPEELGMKGNYTQAFRTACANIYAELAKKRKTFCADPKNKTKPNFSWNCPQPTTPSQTASDQSVDTQKAAEEAQKAKDDAYMSKIESGQASEAKDAQEFTTKMAEYRTKLNGYDNMTQEQLEALINEINAYWKKSLLARADSPAEQTYRRVFPKFNTEFKEKFPAITVLLNTK